MVTTGAIAISNMSPAFADIPESGVPKGEEPIFEKIPNAYIPEMEDVPTWSEEDDDEAVEPGDDIMDDVISGEEYEEEETEDVTDEDEPIDEEIIDEAEMERLEREEHEKELAEKEKAEEDDDEIMDEIEKDAEKYDKENEEDVIGGIDDDYYDVGEEEEVKDEDPAENIPDEDDEEVKESNNKEATHNATTKDTNVSNDTARAIDKPMPSKLKEYQRELEKPLNLSKDNSANPKTGDMGIIGSIVGMVTAVGGIILRKKL